MPETKQDKHEKALDLTEAALEALDKGDEAKADKLIDQAKKLDPTALKEVVQDLAEAERGADSLDQQEVGEEDLDDEEFDEEDEEAAG